MLRMVSSRSFVRCSSRSERPPARSDPHPPPPRAHQLRRQALYDTHPHRPPRLSLAHATSRAMTSSFGEFRTTHFHAGHRHQHRRYHRTPGHRCTRRIHLARHHQRDTGTARCSTSGIRTATRRPMRICSASLHGLKRRSMPNSNAQGAIRSRSTSRLRRFPVTAGQVVAFAGESGSGSAHLHFEIRDENNNTINPLLTSGISITDDLRPLFRGALFAPLTYRDTVSTVHTSSCTLAVRETAPGQYTMNGTPGDIRCGRVRGRRP